MEPVISKKQLFQQLSATLGKTKVVELSIILHTSNFELRDLIDLTLVPEKEIAFRAAWLLENLLLSDPDRFVNHVDYLVNKFTGVTNRSCQRHYTKILMHLTDAKALEPVKQKVSVINLEPIAECCFDLLIDAKTPVAVKVFASEVLFNLRLRYTWIAEILADQIKIMMDGGKPAIQVRGKKLLNLLRL